jgi:hypothetical protein
MMTEIFFSFIFIIIYYAYELTTMSIYLHNYLYSWLYLLSKKYMTSYIKFVLIFFPLIFIIFYYIFNNIYELTYIKFVLIYIIYFIFFPPTFIIFYYVFNNIHELTTMSIYLYNFIYSCLYCLFMLISIVSIIVTDDIKQCIIYLSIGFCFIIFILNLITSIFLLVYKM